MRRRGLACLLLASALAGCLAPADVRTLSEPPLASARLTVHNETLAPKEAVRWVGSTAGDGTNPRWGVGIVPCLMDTCWDPPTACTPANCERIPVRIDAPEAPWAMQDGFLELSVRWPTVFEDWFQTRIEDASGNVVATGRAGYFGPFALTARLDRPAPGAYAAVIVHVSGSHAYEAAIQLETRPMRTPTRDLLPNLVTLPPTDLTFADPPSEGPGYLTVVPSEPLAPTHRALGSRGCATEEAAVQGARRCLRFSNAVGNVGEGPLEIRLAIEQGATSMAGGHFTQRILRSDGSRRDAPGGAAEFHAMHAHWHNAAANEYAVYHYDATTQMRGGLVNHGHKAGVCFADIGLVDLGLPYTAPGHYSGAPCLNPALSNDWYMGLSPNWYDNYYWPLVDQYVEVSGAPDGSYVLCSVTNQDGTLAESDYTDNEACAVFELHGDDVQVVSPEPYHHTPN